MEKEPLLPVARSHETKKSQNWIKKALFGLGTATALGIGTFGAYNYQSNALTPEINIEGVNASGLIPPDNSLQKLGNTYSGDKSASDSMDAFSQWFSDCIGEKREHSRDFRVYDDQKMVECFRPLLNNEKAMTNIKPVLKELMECYCPLLSDKQQIEYIGSRLDRKTVESLALLLESPEIVENIMQSARSCSEEDLVKLFCLLSNDQNIEQINRQIQKFQKVCQSLQDTPSDGESAAHRESLESRESHFKVTEEDSSFWNNVGEFVCGVLLVGVLPVVGPLSCILFANWMAYRERLQRLHERLLWSRN